jgi:flagellar hook-associated protein 1 FlgK
MLQKQRSSISGVSLDEEMANLSIYQHAYEASAHLISVVDQMLDTLINIQ